MNDISQFAKLNVADTCSLWNLFASRLLYSTARSAGVQLCCTEFVIYECLYKASPVLPERIELQSRLKRALADQHVTPYKIDVEDLQDLEVLRNRKKLSLGELSVMVFARKPCSRMTGARRSSRERLWQRPQFRARHIFTGGCTLLLFSEMEILSKSVRIFGDLTGASSPILGNIIRKHSAVRRLPIGPIQRLRDDDRFQIRCLPRLQAHPWQD